MTRMWLATVGLAGWLVIASVPARGTFERCKTEFENASDSEAAAECFYTEAVTDEDRAEAVLLLEDYVERFSGAPWLRFYLGNALFRRSCERSAAAYREAIRLFSGEDTEGESRARSNLV